MPEHYLKAPIVEAVIDFRVTLPDSATANVFEQFQQDLQKEFPIQENLIIPAAQYEFNEIPTNSIVNEVKGFRFASKDKRKVLVASTQTFTFSHLEPYDSWNTFRNEAREHWNRYKSIAHPSTISRIGVRYINRIDLPVEKRLHTYLKLHPTIPPIPNRASLGFFMQLQVPQPDIESTLIINEGRVEAPNPDTFSVLFDIDVFRQHTWDAQNDASVWEFLEQLRSRKNEVFEACITQKTRELIS